MTDVLDEFKLEYEDLPKTTKQLKKEAYKMSKEVPSQYQLEYEQVRSKRIIRDAVIAGGALFVAYLIMIVQAIREFVS